MEHGIFPSASVTYRQSLVFCQIVNYVGKTAQRIHKYELNSFTRVLLIEVWVNCRQILKA